MTMHNSAKYTWKIRTLLKILGFLLALSLIVLVSSQEQGTRRSRLRPRLRLKKRIQNSEAEAALSEATGNLKNNNEGIVGSVVGSRGRQLRTRNRVRARRPTIVTPEPPALFDDDEVNKMNRY